MSERNYFPQVAIGIRDLLGTGFVGSEYLVASKEIGNLDITLGLGWGRLAGKGDFKNPMTIISDKFEVRDSFEGLGGELSSGSFFSGKSVGLFGGISYEVPFLPVSLMLEYNPDQYETEVSNGGLTPNSPISAAIKWDARPGLSLTFSSA